MSRPVVLVVGGAGFIGSHTAKQLSRQGFDPVVYDNLSTGTAGSVRWGALVEGDILDKQKLIATIEDFDPIAVIHFAASAYVGESVENPAKYGDAATLRRAIALDHRLVPIDGQDGSPDAGGRLAFRYQP